MMTPRRIAGILTLVVAGCGKSGTTGGSTSATTLTSAEATAVAQQVGRTVVNHFRGLRVRRQGGASAAECQASCGNLSCTVSCPVSDTNPCAAGGRIDTTGTASGTLDLGLSGTISLDERQTYSDCSPSTGVVLNGDPYTTLSGGLPIAAGIVVPPATGTVGGAVRWATRGISGSCPVSLQVVVSASGGTVSGTVCGVPVSTSV